MASATVAEREPAKIGLERLKTGLLKFAEVIGLREEPPASRAGLLDLLKLRYREFNGLLTANNELLEIIAELEGLLRGDKLFGLALLKGKIGEATACTRQMVSGLQTISENRYPVLWPTMDRIELQLMSALEERPRELAEEWVLPLGEIDRSYAGRVGGKMANLGEIRNRVGLPTPEGFAITMAAADHFLAVSGVRTQIGEVLDLIGPGRIDEVSRRIQGAILRAEVPRDLAAAIVGAYAAMGKGAEEAMVSLRSSAVKEDSEASFAGQYATVLNAKGAAGVLESYRRVVASLYGAQAMFYRMHMGIAEEDVAMGVGCVEMVDALASGVAFSRDPVEGAGEQVVIHAVWGLGPSVVDGRVSPDVYLVERESGSGKVEVRVGQKGTRLVGDGNGGVRDEVVEEGQRGQACLSEGEIRQLAEWVLRLEDHFGAPQDVEWALDRGRRLVLLQSRPMREVAARTVEDRGALEGYRLLVESGAVAAPGVGCGIAVHVRSAQDLAYFPKGGVLVARQSSPEYVQVMDRAAAIVTDVGSTIGHMASVAREFGIPTLLGTRVATKVIPPGEEVTVDAVRGRVYLGRVCELLDEHDGSERAFMKGTPVYRDLERVAELVVPLNLTNPHSPQFRAEHCETLHDIARFVHEKAFAEMFGIGALIDDRPTQAVQLDVFLPIDLYIIDLGGGLQLQPGQRKVKRSHVVSYPLAQFVKGMLHEGIPRFGPRPMDLGGFLGVMARHAMTSPEEERTFHDPSYAIVSDKYLNFTSRVGYHFSALDSYCGDTVSKNYVSFRFKGGAAEFVRRVRRVRAVGDILVELGFTVEVKEDLLYARLQKYEREEIGQKLEMLGRLFQFSRQMDLSMVSDGMVGLVRDAFLAGNYALDPDFQPASTSKGS